MQIDPNAFGRGLNQSYGFVTGIANDVRQGQQQNALSAYAQNPDDPNALNALARNGDPRLVMQLRQQQAQQQAGKAEERTKLFGRAAKAAKTPEQWDQIATHLSQNGYPEAAQMVGKFDPNVRAAYMAAAGEEDDSAKQGRIITPQPGGGAYLLGADNQMQELLRPNDGTKQMGQAVVEGSASNTPRVTNAADYDAVPAGEKYITPDGTIRVKPGGQSQPATGGFLDPLGPR